MALRVRDCECDFHAGYGELEIEKAGRVFSFDESFIYFIYINY